MSLSQKLFMWGMIVFSLGVTIILKSVSAPFLMIGAIMMMMSKYV